MDGVGEIKDWKPVDHGRHDDASPELTIVAPTFNELANLDQFIHRIRQALFACSWELIIVDDDSPDGTWRRARLWSTWDHRIRVVRRIGRRGLSGACIEGWLASSAPYLAVIDADGQHDPTLLPDMLDLLRNDAADIVVASRYAPGGDVGKWGGLRAAASLLATRLTRLVSPHAVSDPMSGYFALKRAVVEQSAPHLPTHGFKLLFDLLGCAGPLRALEIPFSFDIRTQGVSKMSSSVAWSWLGSWVETASRSMCSRRLFSYLCIGGFGLILHLCILSIGLSLAANAFLVAQVVAVAVAITSNYTLNNLLTYSDRTKWGWRWFGGLASFAMVCGAGAFANYWVSERLFASGAAWFPAAVAGSVVGGVWNYPVTARFTWGAIA